MTIERISRHHDDMAIASHGSSSKVITFVLMVTFALLSGVIGYAAYKGGNFELRSKAALSEVPLKQWLFATDTEGWVSGDVESAAVERGKYVVQIRDTAEGTRREEVCTGTQKRGNYKCKNKPVTYTLDPSIANGNINTTLRFPLNQLRIRMSVVIPPGTVWKEPSGAMMKRQPRAQIRLVYSIAGRAGNEPPITAMTAFDGESHELLFDFPRDMSLKTIDKMSISFADLRGFAGARILIDEISLLGFTGRLEHTQQYNGVIEQAGDGFRLRTSEPRVYELQNRVSDGCSLGRYCTYFGRRSGVNFASFVGKEVVVLGVIESADSQEHQSDSAARQVPVITVNTVQLASDFVRNTPPAGCHYEQVECVREPCERQLVCPTGTQ